MCAGIVLKSEANHEFKQNFQKLLDEFENEQKILISDLKRIKAQLEEVFGKGGIVGLL